MKNFGKRIVLVLVSFLILAVPFFMTACEFSLEINNKDNSGEITQEENVDLETMSLDDARALMTKVCMACTGVKDANKLSPASVENYNYDEVQLRDLDGIGISPAGTVLLVKFALDYGEQKEDYLKTNVEVGPDVYSWYYVAYKLQKKSVLFDVTIPSSNPDLVGIDAKTVIEVRDLGNDNWSCEFYGYYEIKNHEAVSSWNILGTYAKFSFCGVGSSLKKCEHTRVDVDIDAYASGLISKEDLVYFDYKYFDAIEHKKIDTCVSHPNLPDEAVDFVNDCCDSVKKAWKPEFDETKFKDCPAIQEKANEVMNEFRNQSGD